MPKLFLWKSLHLCFSSNLTKCYSSSSDLEDSDHQNRRPSFVLINNFNLLYHDDNHHMTTTSSSSMSSFESDISPELSAAFASRRFFFSSPGRSNAITDNYDTVTTTTKKKSNDTTVNTTKLLSGGTAVKQHVYSPDPLSDFRRSMQEMINAAGELDRQEDEYDFLNELLLSYLSLNSIDTHKFVIRAFSDILVSLLSKEPRSMLTWRTPG